MVSTIKIHLLCLRDTGIPLDLTAIRGYMISVITHMAPELFKREIWSGQLFICCESFVRSFLHDILGWSRRRPTRAAQKVPANAGKFLLRSFLRMACAIRDECVPSSCIVNANQTQVAYSHGSQYTWNQQGARQVQVVGMEEKRAYTMLVGVSNNSNVLPFQAIYQGKTSGSLPNPLCASYDEAMEIGMQFLPSLTDTYWSTLETMQTYVTDILAPYFRAQ